MGRPKGSRQINKKTVTRICQRCGNMMTQQGSGPPKKYCCKQPKKLKQLLKGTSMSRGINLVLQDKLARGECVLHAKYHEGRRKFVTIQNHQMFAYDHIDRSTKKGTIAKIKDAGPNVLAAELLKCQLVCHNCHAMKTYEDRDWHKHNKEITTHPSLFDHE